MPIISSRVTVGTTAVQIAVPDHGSVTDPITCSIRNPGPNSVYIGGEFVTAAAGYELTPGATFDLDLIAGDVLFGITSASTQEVHVLKVRQ